MDPTKGLHYKIRTMGVLIDGQTSVFCDNKSVVTSTYVPTSIFSKKHLGIYYHAVREAVATGINFIEYIDGEFNPTYVLTNLLTAAVKRPHIGQILY